MLRPIDSKAKRRRESDIHPAERSSLQKQKEKAAFLKRNPHYIRRK
jgi:hypothetical protein